MSQEIVCGTPQPKQSRQPGFGDGQALHQLWRLVCGVQKVEWHMFDQGVEIVQPHDNTPELSQSSIQERTSVDKFGIGLIPPDHVDEIRSSIPPWTKKKKPIDSVHEHTVAGCVNFASLLRPRNRWVLKRSIARTNDTQKLTLRMRNLTAHCASTVLAKARVTGKDLDIWIQSGWAVLVILPLCKDLSSQDLVTLVRMLPVKSVWTISVEADRIRKRRYVKLGELAAAWTFWWCLSPEFVLYVRVKPCTWPAHEKVRGELLRQKDRVWAKGMTTVRRVRAAY